MEGSLESVSEESLVLRTEVSSLQSISKSSIRKITVCRAPRKRMVVTLITSGLTAILMFGVIPDKLYDSPKSIMLSLAAGVTAPATYFVFRQTRRRTVYRAEGPEPSASVAIVQHPSDTHAVSAASLQYGCDLPCPAGLRALVVGRRRDRLRRVLHRLHRLLVHARQRTRRGRDADFGRS